MPLLSFIINFSVEFTITGSPAFSLALPLAVHWLLILII
jgi:hypothetical protein